ncbi:hypothetical protein CANCADRAFT_2375 [Tortispora caseinolytica NRRL Y-17796]|uniref:Enoyl-CoA hydratase n=1 Tax=Tortispora caseinolytica NRRL Y-17796 TaxID=767744 RepID=A0A1E4TFT8_9ASCO|nr:hypothetical protein CANCADRAFT_2375 [Tortispora caseinolytica NRRL Y-17796]
MIRQVIKSKSFGVVKAEVRKGYDIILMNNAPENRLEPELYQGLLNSFSFFEEVHGDNQNCYPPLITTSEITKFFSNGLNLEVLAKDPVNFLNNLAFPAMKRYLEYPAPTIAYINGHAYAGGFLLAICSDYAIMNPKKGFMCMNEIIFGAPLEVPFASILLDKISDRKLLRRIMLEGERFTAQQAAEVGIIDSPGDFEDAEKLAEKLKTAGKPAYGLTKKAIYRDSIHALSNPPNTVGSNLNIFALVDQTKPKPKNKL